MEKKTKKTNQIWLMAIAALVVGFLIGYSINRIPPAEDNIAGSIGKLDRYRNIKISQEDIQLRNALLDDSLKRNQYEQYLMYYYYQALRTSTDAQQVLSRTTKVEDFNKLYYPYADALEQYSQYLEAARNDIFEALTLIVSLDDNETLPVIHYLNQAQNAIARIKHHDAILMNYMKAMASYLDENRQSNNELLEEAHDILLFNLANGAILSQNKPVLSYLDKQQFKSSGESRKTITSEVAFHAIDQQFMLDAELLGFDFPCICNMEELTAVMMNNIEQLNFIFGEEQMGTILLIPSTETLGLMQFNEQLLVTQMGNFESLSVVADMESLKLSY